MSNVLMQDDCHRYPVSSSPGTETPAERPRSWSITADMTLQQELEVRRRRMEELRRGMSADEERAVRRKLRLLPGKPIEAMRRRRDVERLNPARV